MIPRFPWPRLGQTNLLDLLFIFARGMDNVARGSLIEEYDIFCLEAAGV